MNDLENANSPLENSAANNNNDQRVNLLENQDNLPQESEEIEAASNAFTVQCLIAEFRWSPKTNLIAMFLSLSKVIASIAVLTTNNLCFNPFQILLIAMLVHDSLSCLTTMFMSFSLYRVNRITNSEPSRANNAPAAGEDLNSLQREVDLNLQRRRAIKSFARMLQFGIKASNRLDIIYFFIFMTANVLYFIYVNHRSCSNESEGNLLLAFLIMGHLWFLGPLTFLIILGILSPIIPPILLCLRRRQEQIKTRLLRKLKVQKFSNTLPTPHECSICIMEYENNDDITQLKCHPMHHFHDECIRPWLQANGKCPLCRVSLEEMFKK